MKTKETLRTKIFKRFFGIGGVIDEYKQQEINRIGSNAFVILYFYLLVSSAIASLFGLQHPAKTFLPYLACNLIFGFFGITLYIIGATIKRHLIDHEVEKKEMASSKKKIAWKSVGLTIYFMIGMHLISGMIEFFDGGNFIKTLTSPRRIVTSIIGGIFFGLFMYAYERFRLKKVE